MNRLKLILVAIKISFDTYKAIDYKLDAMNKEVKKIEYLIEFHLDKNKKSWELVELSDTEISKIQGVF